MMNVVFLVTQIFIILMFFLQPVHAIDCFNRKDKLDFLICSKKSIIDLDEKLNDFYIKINALKSGQGLNDFKTNQLQWLKKRNSCLKKSDPADCVTRMYETRVQDFKNEYDNTERLLSKQFDESFKQFFKSDPKNSKTVNYDFNNIEKDFKKLSSSSKKTSDALDLLTKIYPQKLKERLSNSELISQIESAEYLVTTRVLDESGMKVLISIINIWINIGLYEQEEIVIILRAEKKTETSWLVNEPLIIEGQSCREASDHLLDIKKFEDNQLEFNEVRSIICSPSPSSKQSQRWPRSPVT